MTYQLVERIRDTIFTVDYPIRFSGMDLYSRMTIVKLSDGKLWLHSPCKPDPGLKSQIDEIGEVAYIVAPGNFHHLHVADIQTEYPEAETFLCPGLEKKRTGLEFDWILGNRPDPRWGSEFDQVLVQGTRFINEVAFFHRPTNTLILVDLLENIGDDYTHEASLNPRARSTARDVARGFLVAHAVLHFAFSGHPSYEFSSLLSKVLIYGAALCGIAYLLARWMEKEPLASR